MKVRLMVDVCLMVILIVTGMLMTQTVGTVIVTDSRHLQEYHQQERREELERGWIFQAERKREEEGTTTTNVTPQPQCTWAPDPGPCHAFFRRYYYNWYTHVSYSTRFLLFFLTA